MNANRAFSLCVVILLASGGAAAADDGFSRSGAYLGLGGSGVFHLFEDEVDKQSGGTVEAEASAGLNARVGYRLLSWLALEAQYEWVAGIDFVAKEDLSPVADKGDTLARLESHALTANAKFLLPIWRIQPYLTIGVGGTIYDLDDKTGLGFGKNESAFVGRVGVGGDVYITKNLLAFVEGSGLLSTLDVTAPTISKNISDLHYFSLQLGLQYRF